MKQTSDVVREDIKLMRQTRTIFGDIVTKAWIISYHYDHMSKKETEEMLDGISKRLADQKNKGVLRFDGESVILEFNKDKTVMFTSSEWSSMQKVDVSAFRTM